MAFYSILKPLTPLWRRLFCDSRVVLASLTLLACCFWASSLSFADSVVRCKDAKGKVQYTDDRRQCAPDAQAQDVRVELQNTHSKYGSVISRDYYSYPFRAHKELQGYGIELMVEQALLDSDRALTDAAAKRLAHFHSLALKLFPPRHRESFSGVRYYIYAGDEYKDQSLVRGLWYFRTGNSISPRWDDSIVVRSASYYMSISDRRALAVAVHELAHGFYFYHYKRISPKAKHAFQLAQSSNLYKNITSYSGKNIEKAYALTNEREYFAELSVMLLDENARYPFSSIELSVYDPAGYALVRNAWLDL